MIKQSLVCLCALAFSLASAQDLKAPFSTKTSSASSGIIDSSTPSNTSTLIESSSPLKDSTAIDSSKPDDSTAEGSLIDQGGGLQSESMHPSSIIQSVNKNLSKAFMQEANPYNINYDNLDPKYYRFMRFYNKYYDSDIAKLITAVDASELKSGFFVGGNLNLKLGTPLNAGLELTAGFINLKGGGRLGLFTPNGPVGYRLYVNYIQSFGGGFITYFGGNADLLIHLPFGYKKQQGFELALGLGLGNLLSKSNASSNFKLGGSLNAGMSYVLKKHRVELGVKVLAPINLTNFDTYFIVPSIGYAYVF
ncbi:hypothetical protein BKH43_06715 [Helicobacter sp. 13S00401-1]|uniref:hypothetical protein n=1 Tax=Helicobacter sp. 13S00401-1 TaxID=1905758 RepID=UPI000BA7B081|nr:hypothetical protein [Helicobacter sp. 13S00401-1]PAF49338.1 hypothetical protein BKH43_06715 [Helicobacter sp. 13S00401-1]